jgi:hypothetical protein
MSSLLIKKLDKKYLLKIIMKQLMMITRIALVPAQVQYG